MASLRLYVCMHDAHVGPEELRTHRVGLVKRSRTSARCGVQQLFRNLIVALARTKAVLA